MLVRNLLGIQLRPPRNFMDLHYSDPLVLDLISVGIYNAVNILRNSRTTNDYRQVMDQVKTSVETIYFYVKNTSNSSVAQFTYSFVTYLFRMYLLAIAELIEIFVVRMDKPIVAAINIGSLLFMLKNYSLLWYIRSAKQQLVGI